MPAPRALAPDAAMTLAAPQTIEQFAAYNWDGLLDAPAPAGSADYANLVQWLTTRYGIIDTPRHVRIWHYYQDERGRVPPGGGATATVDAVPAANAVARYVWATRDSVAGRLDWTKINPNHNGPAQVVGTGVFYRRTPGGSPAARVDTPANVTIGRYRAHGGWFYARESPGTEGWVSVYWLKFP
jgi:hypothetical protein